MMMMMMMIIQYDIIINYVRTPARRALQLALSHMRIPLAHTCTPAAGRRLAPHHATLRAARPHHTTVLESSMHTTAYHTVTLVSLGVTVLAKPPSLLPKHTMPPTTHEPRLACFLFLRLAEPMADRLFHRA